MSERRAQRALCLDDFEAMSRRHLPRPIFGYVAGATERNAALDDNARAYSEWGFQPRVLVDVSKRSPKATLFGREWAAPFGLAPMGMSALAAYRGDIVLTAAARAANVPAILSGSSLIRMEEVIAANPDAWFQAYLPGDSRRVEALVDRVARAGFGTLMLTVDTAVLPNRENNVRNGFSTPLKPSLRLLWDGMTHPEWSFMTFLRTWAKFGMPHFENSFAERGAPILARNVERDFTARDHLNWEHLALIRRRWTGRLMIKGVIHPDDAVRAREEGCDGVIVSNHGGRQLDGTTSPLRLLPAMRAAVGDFPLIVDGGIRRGTDILKALALGADFVLIGRPMLHAAAVAGRAGVDRAIALVKGELDRNMALLGVNSLAEIGPHCLVRVK
ncbi:alpha-hydroxy acid oxidase [Roseococcus microcysteis]|uniref:alpha-hydroxy acid oxidase n=1 Tax=Roseococcus microcysteis TaxID=2771361 RepID=UPI00168A872A|nr:alpha-hydroxy acid oxidase [Roseococcus microcysteis]